MTCPNCGAAVAENRRFCGKCGTALITEATPDPSAAAGAIADPSSPPSAWGGGALTAPPAPPDGAPVGPPAATPDPFAPPDLHPGYAGYPPPPPGYGAPPPGYGAPPPYPPAGYPGGAPGWPGYGYGPPHTNGLAIASLVIGLVGWPFCGIGSVVAIVLGYIARSQIKQSWGRQTGSGMATAGIVLGFLGTAFMLVIFITSLFGNST